MIHATTARTAIAIVATTAAITTMALHGEPARAYDLSRPEVRSFVDDVVKKNRLDRRWVEKVVTAAEPKTAIVDAMNRPAERVRPWFEYRATFLTAKRIADGRAFFAEHAARSLALEQTEGLVHVKLDRAEKRNAIDLDTCRALKTFLFDADRDPAWPIEWRGRGAGSVRNTPRITSPFSPSRIDKRPQADADCVAAHSSTVMDTAAVCSRRGARPFDERRATTVGAGSWR
mgnify:CR=1 FL=1